MGSERPYWMEQDAKKRPPAPKRPIPPAPPPPSPPSTHRNVVVGVTILAGLSLFSLFYWVGIVVAGWISPPAGPIVFLEDYLTFGRSVVGVVTGTIGTIAVWQIVDSAID